MPVVRTSTRWAGLAVCVSLLLVTPPAVAASHVTAPPVHGRFDYQIGGSYTPRADVRIVDRDRHSKPAPGVYSICYVNAFQTQPEENGWWLKHHPDLLLRNAKGKLVQDPDWPGESLFDTSTSAKRAALMKVHGRWLDYCAMKGFRAVEPDNLDSWTRSHGLLTKAENLAFAKLLVVRGHHDRLAMAQKNTTELGSAGKSTAHFDFAIAEECQVYTECGSYTSVYGRHVIEIEYTDNGRKAFTAACKARGSRISVILRDRDVVKRGRSAYRYSVC